MVCGSPLFVTGEHMKIKLFGFPIFEILNVGTKNIRGYKVSLCRLLHTTLTFGDHKGGHIHFSMGVYKYEVFGGLTVWS